jgi:DNA polymerase-3 subunit delta
VEIQQVIDDARAGKFEPVYVLVGAEKFLIERAIGLLRKASLDEGTAGFNADVFHGQGLEARKLISAAKTIPMMARHRFVLVRDAEDIAAGEQDALAGYIAEPSPSTCVVFVAEKLDGRSKLAKAAKDRGVWTEAGALKGGAVHQFARQEARSRGHDLGPGASEALIDATGFDLSAIDDALERLSLYVGAGQTIDVAAVENVVARVRVDTIWTVVDAVSSRDAGRAMSSLRSLLADREPPLRIMGMVARQLRIVARMREALASGLRGPEAAKHAGAPPFKARELTEAARRFAFADLRTAFRALADADLALKGSKRPPETVIEDAVLSMTRPR